MDGLIVGHDLLTVGEVAKYLKVPVSWVYERTRTRELPVRKLGRHVRIPKSELIDWVDRQTAPADGHTVSRGSQ